MNIAMFDSHSFEKHFFEETNGKYNFEWKFYSERLNAETVSMAKGFDAVCCFVNDHIDESTIDGLDQLGIRLIVLRCAGYNNIDLKSAKKNEITVLRVPAYSPHSVAEHAVAMLLCMNRKLHHSYTRIKEQNFSLDGLVGFDLFGKTVGIVGTGKIGRVFAKILHGFGCKIVAFDLECDKQLETELGVKYITFDELLTVSDIVSLHLPLNPETHHIINEPALRKMKSTALLINTGRGALIDTKALIMALKKSWIGAAGLDVYEEEEGVFFENLSDQVLQDDVLARLTTFSNVLITSHQGFLTREALNNIATTTFENIEAFKEKRMLVNEISFKD